MPMSLENRKKAADRMKAMVEARRANVQDPTKSVPLEERIGRNTQKLGESETRSLRIQIAQREEEIRGKKDLNPDADVTLEQKDIDHKKMILSHDEDLRPKSGTQTDRLAFRAREIESILKSKMPTKREMWPKPGSAEAQQGLRHNLAFQDDKTPYPGLCREWQDIQRRLNPDDPSAQSLELIRPD